ncbi:hypothetical protein HanXRQr2_Chr17g0817551 [Helianthus annuus]|uniref:Uncharacterized protein n=1 Tax=Helianthus annuus TaxID=4232 RepID=A0A9K3GV75_HELAN|nr:hypothetical protein HanXRQr2_Chr17g0817551 [Helianthus annuus]KAJ0814391.1 hypothetical protein HanPSC8_Chr17g0785181 [Helianthus annuus]
MARIIKSVKTNKISIQKRLQDLLPHRHCSIDFRRRERAMQKKPHPQPIKMSSQERRKHH